MKPHRFVLIVALLCFVKFVISPMSEIETTIWLLPAAMVLFLVGCVMGSFEDDRKHGDHATRDGLILSLVFFVVTKLPAIAALIFGLIMVVVTS